MILARIDQHDVWHRRAVVAQAGIEQEHALGPWLEQMMSLLEQAASRSLGRS